MISKKTLFANELMREIVAIRVNTLWKMLALEKRGELPAINEEGATGKYDNKGAIFIPGGLVQQDVDESSIEHTPWNMKPHRFREQIRDAMRFDNATLLYPAGIATGVNLDTGFFSKAARRIYTFKKAAFRRKKKIGDGALPEVGSSDIIRSHCPVSFVAPYGSRTRISTCVAMGLVEPAMFFAYCRAELNFSRKLALLFAGKLDEAQEQVMGDGGTVFFSPSIVVCHDTRYSETSYTGMTRVLGIGKFGEFCTFTLERAGNRLLRELKRKKRKYEKTDIFAEYEGRRILGIARIYSATNPGRRSNKYKLYVLSPREDLKLDPRKIEEQARKEYNID